MTSQDPTAVGDAAAPLTGFAAKVARDLAGVVADVEAPLAGLAAKVAREQGAPPPAAATVPPAAVPGQGSFTPADRDAEVAALNARLAYLAGYSAELAAPPPPAPPVTPAGVRAYSLSPQGVPVQTGVPEDFAAAREAVLATQLTAEEIAEFRALRADKKLRDEQAAREAAEAAARLSPPSHHVLLADGSRVEGSQIATHYATPDGRLVPVIACHELAPAL